jgi:competence protein ComGC
LKPPIRHPTTAAFTRVELVVVIVIVALLVGLVIPAQIRKKARSIRGGCVNNLHQIQAGYRILSDDQKDTFPAFANQNDGGWRDAITNGNPERLVWTNFFLLRDYVGNAPMLMVCPADERESAADFTLRNFNSNTCVSYFVNPYANDNFPQAILGGDRNLTGNPKDSSYGYSPANGTGFDTATIPLRTNTTNIYWSRQMHSKGAGQTCGNLMIGDGSVQQSDSAGLRKYLSESSDAMSASTNVVRLLLP